MKLSPSSITIIPDTLFIITEILLNAIPRVLNATPIRENTIENPNIKASINGTAPLFLLNPSSYVAAPI